LEIKLAQTEIEICGVLVFAEWQVERLSLQSCEVQPSRKQKFSSCPRKQEPDYNILVHETAQFQLHGKSYDRDIRRSISH